MKKLTSISYFLKLLFFLVLLASFFNTVATSIGFSFPYNTFLFKAEDLFADYFKVMDALRITDSWEGENFYDEIGINFLPPAVIAIYTLMAVLLKYVHSKFLVFFIVFLVPLFILFYNSKKFKNQSPYWWLVLFSYPLLQILTRANISILVFVSLAIYIICIRNYYLGMVLLAVAVSIKVTPIIFLGYFIIYYRRDLKTIFKGVAFFIVSLFIINYLSVLLILKHIPSSVYNPDNFFTSLKTYEDVMVYSLGGLRYGSSFYMAFRFILLYVERITNLSFFNLLLSLNALVINAFVIFVFVLIYLWKNSFSKALELVVNPYFVIKLVCLIFVLFTPVTADYYLSILFLPLFVVPFEKFKLSEKILYLLILSPKNYFFVLEGVSLQVLLNPLLLLLMLCVITDIFKFNWDVREELQPELTFSQVAG